MNLMITGANGFIGYKFISLYGSEYENIHLIGRNFDARLKNLANVTISNWHLSDPIFLKLDHKIDVFIHLAYDGVVLENNVIAINNILEYIKLKTISRFIFMSSFSVYATNYKGSLNEEVPYSQLNDPYSKDKIACEQLIYKFSKVSPTVKCVVLQPTIVYGMTGNWSLHAIKSLATKELILPAEGVCNPVYVDDVCQSIYLSSIFYLPKSNFQKFLISSNESSNWKKFYIAHSVYLPQLITNEIEFNDDASNNLFDTTLLKNTLYHIMFSKFGYIILKLLMPLIRKTKPTKINSTDLNKSIIDWSQNPPFKPTGMNRVAHRIKFKVDISKAKSYLSYSPSYLLSNLAHKIDDQP
jgi:dTDP-4-dehydrorhamnose reductase